MALISTIQLGLRLGYYQYKQFGDSPEGFADKMTEYLLTVFVAIELNSDAFEGKAIQIKLEYPLWQFYQNAFPAIRYPSRDDLFNMSDYIKREYTKKRTKQRIDITILKVDVDQQLRSVHGIELKAINTRYSDVIADLDRLSGAMITIDNADENSITSCYSGFIKSYKNHEAPITKDEIESLRAEKLMEIETLLNVNLRNNVKYKALEYVVHSANIDSVSAEEYLNIYDGAPDSEPEQSSVEDKTGEVLGVVIEIKRK